MKFARRNSRLAGALAASFALIAISPIAWADPELATRVLRSGPVLRGADLDLTLWVVSGLDTAPGAYESQLALILSPKFHIGERWFRGRWLEPLTVSARLLIEGELAGNGGEFRGPNFASPAVLRDTPEAVAIGQAQGGAPVPSAGQSGGADRRVSVSDLRLSVIHDRVWVIPKIKVNVESDFRVVVPTSLESRIAGLIAAPSLFLGLQRKIWRFNLEYGFRAVKYFYSTSVAPIAQTGGTVLVNGQVVQPYQPASTGRLNPSFGFVNFFSATLDLPKNLSIEADYFVFNSFSYTLDSCSVPGVPAANVCADGALLGDVRRPAERDEQWFLIEFDWKPFPWGTIGLGISTFQPIRYPNGAIANPLLRVSRDNYSTAFLSLAINAEALATAITRRKR